MLYVRGKNAGGVEGEHYPGPPSKRTCHQSERPDDFAGASEKDDLTGRRNPIWHYRKKRLGSSQVEDAHDEVKNRHCPAHPAPDLVITQERYSSSFLRPPLR